MSNLDLSFQGAAKKLDDIDLPRIGARIGVGEDELHAFMEVEASGSGFDSQGRPKMLFEPHVFWRQLGSGLKREEAVRKGLAYRAWGTNPYPKDSYPRLLQAIKIDMTAALKSASWGLGQIMGFNHKLVGYPTVVEMVQAFMDDEENHLAAIVEFLKSAKLDDDLRNHNWRGLAQGYNGSEYWRHGYHTKLERAYAKWRKIKDTPYP